MNIRVMKRSGEEAAFQPEKIENAIYLASAKSLNGACRELAERVVRTFSWTATGKMWQRNIFSIAGPGL